MMRKIVSDARKVEALYQQLWEVDAQDDGCAVEDYEDEFIISEALYVLSTYYEGGHINSDMLLGFDGVESRRIASREVGQLERFKLKYEGMARPTARSDGPI
tara:strand:+ start:207 stop:512 length:306 start_codon:yes stop_codon:yes gene_type:complete